MKKNTGYTSSLSDFTTWELKREITRRESVEGLRNAIINQLQNIESTRELHAILDEVNKRS